MPDAAADARAQDEQACVRRRDPAAAARLAAVALAATVCAVATGAAAGAVAAQASAAPVTAAPLLVAPVRLPPQLLAAAQAMEAVRVSSERFSVRTAVSSAGAHLPREAERLLKLLFDTRLSGEATRSPPTGVFALTALGRTVTLRLVRGHTYLYEPGFAARDGGRPWVDLGRRGLGPGLGAAGSPPVSGSEPESFVKLAAALRAARALRELGTGTVDGQAVTGYRAVVPSGLLQQQTQGPRAVRPPAILGGAFGGGALAAAEPPDENLLLEVFVTPAGVPVRAHVSLTAEGFSFSALSDVYAINFPLAVSPPPRRLTIGFAGLQRIARQRARR